MTFCLYEFSISDEIQEKARNDVRKAIKKHNGKLTYDALADMKYLEKCLSETLRKYPIAFSLLRTALHDYKIPDTEITIPKGTMVTIPIYAIHWDENLYPDPEKFDPERFTQEQISARHSMAYIPFGAGPRTCIGYRFGHVETKLGLAKILMNYKFNLDQSKTTVPLKISPTSAIILSPAENIFVNISKY